MKTGREIPGGVSRTRRHNDSIVASTSSRARASRMTAVSGKAVSRPPPRLSTARMFPAAISLEPHAAGPVHRVRNDHDRPGQPLRDVGVRRHRDSRAGLDRHPPGLADGHDQLRQLPFWHAGDPRGMFASVRRDGGAQLVAAVERAGPFWKQFADEVRQDRVAGARPRRHVAGGEPCGLGPPRVYHPHLSMLAQRANGRCRARRRRGVAVRDDWVDPEVDHQPGPVVIRVRVRGSRRPASRSAD